MLAFALKKHMILDSAAPLVIIHAKPAQMEVAVLHASLVAEEWLMALEFAFAQLAIMIKMVLL